MNLSIIVPVYNGEKFLADRIDNILEQAYKDFELIIVNDGSTDSTKAICDSYEGKDSRVKFIHIKNSGVSTARNTGINAAKGKYIGFVDCDDRIDNAMYQTLISDMEKNDVDLVMCSYVSEFDDHSDKNLFEEANVKFEGKQIREKITENMISSIAEDGTYHEAIMGSVWRCLFKKEILEKGNVSFDKELKYAEDLVFLLEYLEECESAYLTNDLFYFYNRKSEAESTTQKHILGLENNMDSVQQRILEILNIPNFKETKVWALREVTNVYTLAVNIALQKDKSFRAKVKELSEMVKRRKFKYYSGLLNSNEFYGLNKLVILSLKYKLNFLVIKYYSK